MNAKLILVCLLLTANLAVNADVAVADLESSYYPVAAENEEYSHNVGTCDSERTKRRAHLFSKSNYNKMKDVEMQSVCYKTCEKLAEEQDASEALSCIRECNDQQREQRQNGFNASRGWLNTASTLGLLLKAL